MDDPVPAPSKKIFASELGLYEASQPAPPPANEILLGRRRQRARLLDLLRGAGARGAYLVTGYRGSGKTTFVNFVLDEYRQEVYERFVRSKVGRRGLDLLFFAVTILAILVFFLLASQFFEFWSTQVIPANPVSSSLPGSSLVLEYAVWLALVLVLLLPMYHGLRVMHRVFHPFGRWRWLVLPSTILVLWYWVPVAKPTDTPWIFIALLGITYGYVRTYSFAFRRDVDVNPSSAYPSKRLRTSQTRPSGRRVLFLAICGGLISALLAGLIICRVRPFSDGGIFDAGQAARDFSIQQVSVVVLLAGFATGLWFRKQDSASVRHLLPSASHLSASSNRSHWFMVGAVGIALVVVLVESSAWLRLLLLFCVLTIPVFMVGWYARRIKGQDSRCWTLFIPRPRIALALTSLFVCVCVLQLLRPMIREVSSLPQVEGSNIRKFLKEHSLSSSLSSKLAAVPGDTEKCPRLWSRGDSVEWVLGVALCLLCMSLLEYDWVIRRHSTARADNADEPQDSQYGQSIETIVANRRLAHVSMFWISMSAWRPVIVVRTSLGIDKLKHRSVIATMLAELREQFRREFISWRSGIGLISRIIWIAVVTSLSLIISESLIGTAAYSDGVLDRGYEYPDHRTGDDDLLSAYFFLKTGEEAEGEEARGEEARGEETEGEETEGEETEGEGTAGEGTAGEGTAKGAAATGAAAKGEEKVLKLTIYSVLVWLAWISTDPSLPNAAWPE